MPKKPESELVWPKQSIASYGCGPKKMSDHYCYVGLFKNHVNLGFYYGSSLEDPTGLLEGSGKNLRHAKIIRPDELDSPELKALVTQASRYLPNRKD